MPTPLNYRRLLLSFDDLLSPDYNLLLEPILVGCYPPLHNDVKPIKDRPDAIYTSSRSKVVWPCHYLALKKNQQQSITEPGGTLKSTYQVFVHLEEYVKLPKMPINSNRRHGHRRVPAHESFLAQR